LTIADDFMIKDGGTIGVASDADAITIASNGQLTLTQTLIGTALDISGDIDVDGTTNLDVVDIDGAVDMATTLQVDGAITSSANMTITGNVISNDGSNNARFQFDNNNQILIQNDTAMNFYVNGTNSLIIDNNGGIDVEAGSIHFSSAGKGIYLGVTSATASNLLDDYEEGTFTATIADSDGGAVGPNVTGKYTKIGNQVHISFGSFNNIDTTGLSSTSVVRVQGLPFTVGNTYGATGSWIFNNINQNAATLQITPVAITGQAYIHFIQMGDNNASVTSTVGAFTDDTADIIALSLTYLVA